MNRIAVFLTMVSLSAAGAVSANEKTPNPSGRMMERVIENYIQTQELLARDADVQEVRASAKSVAASAEKIEDKSLADEIKTAAESVGASTNLSSARSRFKSLSVPIVRWVERSKPPGIEIVYCSMAAAKWVQKSGSVRNPYYGKEMLACGEKLSGS